MVKGVGVDMVDIARMRCLVDGMTEGALGRMFTAYELDCANRRRDRSEYLATRYAAKEAVFKALSCAVPGLRLDYRKVETRNREDGAPYVVVDGALGEAMAAAGATVMHISITTEANFATAFVVVE